MAELRGLQGKEIADDFKRKEIATGRWRHGWEVFKTNFWKLVALNLLMLVTFIPAITVVAYRNAYVEGLAAAYPFNAAAGFPFYPRGALSGLAEELYLWVDVRFFALLVASGLIASVGIAGAAYSIRKLLQTKNLFNIKGFLHGIKVGYVKTAVPVTLFMAFLYAAFISRDWMRLQYAVGGNIGGSVTLFVFAVIFTVLAGIYLSVLFSLGVSYRAKAGDLIRNSFVLIFSTPLQTIFMLGFTLIPVWLVMLFWKTGFWLILVYIIFAFFGFTFILISWLGYTQWAVDLFVTPSYITEKNEKPAKTDRESAIDREEDERRKSLALLAAGKSDLIARPVKPIGEGYAVNPLGGTFTRAQVVQVAAERGKLCEEVREYEKAHENEAVYVEYNKMFEDREKALVAKEGKGKKNKNKKVSAENLLG